MATGERPSAAIANSRLIKADELAALLGVSTRTLWRMLSNQRIPQPVRLGGCTRWRLDQVQRWIAGDCPDLSEGT